jgi:uncharacterized protein YydD (DUF2326 family)
MIHRVFSDLSTFKPIRFHEGLNILVAEKTRTSTDRQTRNGAGKSSLIELIHFVLGADCKGGCIFRNEALRGHLFGIELDVAQQSVRASRSGNTPSTLLVSGLDGTTGSTTRAPQSNLLADQGYDLAEWREILGAEFFELPPNDRRPRFAPTFRSLIPYFARRQSTGGLELPERCDKNQQLGSQQIAVSYLLGLDWDVPRQLQEVRKKEKTIRQLRKAAREGTLGRIIPSAAELRANLTLAERRVTALKERIASFVVLPEYTEREQEAAELTQRLNALADENTTDRLLIEDLEQAMATEAPPQANDVERLYAQAGVVLPDSVARRFEEVRTFHSSIVQNRRSHLRGEVQAAGQRIAAREREQAELDRLPDPRQPSVRRRRRPPSRQGPAPRCRARRQARLPVHRHAQLRRASQGRAAAGVRCPPAYARRGADRCVRDRWAVRAEVLLTRSVALPTRSSPDEVT